MARKYANKNEMMEIFDISPPSLAAWIRRGLPVVERGNLTKPWRFDVEECKRWRSEMQANSSQKWRGATDQPPVTQTETFHQAKTFKQVYLGRLSRLEYESAAARYVPAESARLEAFSLGRQLQKALDGLPARIASLARQAETDFEAREILREAFLSALSEIANSGPSDIL